MKITFIILFSTLIPFLAVSGQVCQNVPGGVSYQSMSVNFDGSVYYKTPKVFFAGDFYRLRYYNGFCEMNGKKYISAALESFHQSVAGIKMNSNGSFEDLVFDFYLIDWIVCK